jgi:vanillate O-demethylase ferredoxin subunit
MKLKVSLIKDVTARVRLFTFVDAAGSDLPAYSAGAHLDFDLGKVGTRSYSLVDFVPTVPVPGAYHIAVQAEPDGDGGSLAMHALGLDDVVEATAPKNSFELHEGDAPALLIAGGIGVTPIISFATALALRGTPYDFHYATRDAQVCAFADQIQDAFADAATLWFDDTNQIDVGQLVQNAPKDAHIYCCGPKGMIEAVKTAAEAAGHPLDRVRFELFETQAPQEGDQSFEVEISDGQTFTIPSGQTIIEVLEEAGVDVMYDCQRGDCGICQTDVLEGEPDHRDVVLSEAERASGKVIQICVSRAKSARLVLDI